VIVAALLTAPLFLLAAKAHGRQVRLERENAGYHDITFGGSRDRSRGEDVPQHVRTNPPFVEALWRRDRTSFWIVTPIAALACGALLFAFSARGAWLLLAAPWGMIAGFLALGAASALRSRDVKAWLWAAAALALVTAVSVVASP
jgi:hypothetical protein